MKYLRIIIPVLVTAGLTVLCIFVATWLTGMVPDGEWAELLKAMIVVFVVASALITVAWSAYFTYIIRTTIRR
jgi:hypothetical protein